MPKTPTPVLSMEDITKITLDYMYRNPDSILAALQAAAAYDDEEMLHDIVAECKIRGIDVAKLIKDDIARHEKLWGKIR